MIYPQKLNSKKSNLIVKIGLIISFILGSMFIILNRIITPQVHWAAIVNGTIVYIGIVLYYTIKRRINIAGHVLLHAIAISILNVYIDYELGFIGWSINISIPIIVIISNIIMLIITIVSHKQYIKYAIYQLFIVFFSSLPFILLTENITKNVFLSVASSTISIINLIVSLVWCTKDVKEAIVRKVHL